MAARLQTIESGVEDYEQALQQFINQSPWDEQAVLDGLQRWIGRRFGTSGSLILDDTGFTKQGTHSVGVARQYTGTLGKVTSCQVAVTLPMVKSLLSMLSCTGRNRGLTIANEWRSRACQNMSVISRNGNWH